MPGLIKDTTLKKKANLSAFFAIAGNDQNTYGVIAKTFWKTTDNLQTSFGIDGRTAKIEHFREVRDLAWRHLF